MVGPTSKGRGGRGRRGEGKRGKGRGGERGEWEEMVILPPLKLRSGYAPGLHQLSIHFRKLSSSS